jgi:hypothetical protein
LFPFSWIQPLSFFPLNYVLSIVLKFLSWPQWVWGTRTSASICCYRWPPWTSTSICCCSPWYPWRIINQLLQCMLNCQLSAISFCFFFHVDWMVYPHLSALCTQWPL